MAYFAYLGFGNNYLLISLLVVGVFFTEPREAMIESTKRSMKVYKIISLILVVGIIGLIWTSMYLAFSEVGAIHIYGIQGRYLIPLFTSVFAIVYTDKTGTQWKNSNYNQIILLILM